MDNKFGIEVNCNDSMMPQVPVTKIGKSLTLQDLIDYAEKIGADPGAVEIKIEDIDTCILHDAHQDDDSVWEPMIVLFC